MPVYYKTRSISLSMLDSNIILGDIRVKTYLETPLLIVLLMQGMRASFFQWSHNKWHSMYHRQSKTQITSPPMNHIQLLIPNAREQRNQIDFPRQGKDDWRQCDRHQSCANSKWRRAKTSTLTVVRAGGESSDGGEDEGS